MKKTLFSLAALASLAFAAPTAYNYEVTPTIGGVLPEGNLDLKNQLTYGLRFGINLDNNIVSQIELGYDRTDNADYKAGRTDDTDFNRYYANIVKEYKMTPEAALYAPSAAMAMHLLQLQVGKCTFRRSNRTSQTGRQWQSMQRLLPLS